MADPLAVVGSLSNLRGLAGTLSHQIQNFVSDVRSAPKVLTAVSVELNKLCSVLNRLDSTLKNDFQSRPPFTPPLIDQLTKVLENCYRVLLRLQDLVQKFSSYGAGMSWQTVLRNVQWIFQESDFPKIQKTLATHTDSLEITLLLTLQIRAHTGEGKTQLENLISQVQSTSHGDPSDIQSGSASTILQYLQMAHGSIFSAPQPPNIGPNAYHNTAHVQSPPIGAPSPLAYNPVPHFSGLPQNPGQMPHNYAPISVPFHSPQNPPYGVPPPGPFITPTGPQTYQGQSPAPTQYAPTAAGDALVKAAAGGDIQMVSTLLQHGVELNTVDRLEGTALYAAASGGFIDIVDLILQRGADPNAKGGFYEYPLVGAIVQGHADAVFSLLKGGANPDTPKAMQKAGEVGNCASIAHLVDFGANVNLPTREDGTGLYEAAYEGHTDAVNLLLQRGADPNIKGGFYGFPLVGAIVQGHADAVLCLLRGRANPNAPSVLSKAGEAGNSAIITYLIDFGADLNLSSGSDGTPLYQAASEGHLEAINLMLSRGANPNAKGGFWGTPLRAAIDRRQEDVVLELLKGRANPNDNAAMQFAAESGNVTILGYLIDFGGNINSVDTTHGTPLHAAAEEGQVDAIRLLLSRGADPRIVGGFYKTPMEAAVQKGHHDAVQALLGG